MTRTKGKPPIDRAAEDAQLSQRSPAAAPLAATVGAAPAGDMPMPTVENNPPCFFRPSANISVLDAMEITLMYWMSLTGQTVEIQPGALRALALPADRVSQLSDSARRFMTPASTN